MEYRLVLLMLLILIYLTPAAVVHAEELHNNQIGFSPGYAILSHLGAQNRASFLVHFRHYISKKLGVELSGLYLIEKRNDDSSEWLLPVHFQLVYSPSRKGDWPVSFLFGGGVDTIFRSDDILGNSNEISFELVTGFSAAHRLADRLILQPRFTLALSPYLGDTQRLGYVVLQVGLAYEW